jgi:Tfp pilus assembly protein PilF
VGDLVREGITGVSANVAEPLLDAIVRPQILFPAYLSGFNLAESFYLATPYLSWQGIVIGDPLCAPFAGPALPRAALDRGIDPETDMPALLSERRLKVLATSNLNIEALKLFLKSSVARFDGKPEDEINALLVRATTIDPRFTVAHLILAQSADHRGDVDEAVAHYWPVVTAEPDNAVALNNLAYLLVERKGMAKEALPLADRAYRLSGSAPVVADTLSWIQFKLGDITSALPLTERAAQAEPGNLEILLHAATIHAAANDLLKARTYLASALKLDPKAADRADVKALAARIR